MMGCATETIEPKLYGSIEGVVIDSESNAQLEGVSIETSPATEVLLTKENGSFEFNDITTGSYQVKAYKPDFKTKSVAIQVWEDRTSSAKILLEPEEEEENTPESHLEAEITSWREVGQSDSSTVEVDYRISNTSSSASISDFEVYFDIHTDQRTFNYEISDSQLGPDEKNYGSFKKFIEDASADSVRIAGTWTNE
jgi:hypothetical protein